MNHETIPFWQKDHPLPRFPSLQKHREVDVCILGAGIAGLTAAYLLTKAKKSVVVLDDGPVAGGQTMRTTGHLTSVLDERYYKLEGTFGELEAKHICESHEEAIAFIEKMVKNHQIDCDFSHVKAYLFATESGSVHELEKELKALHRVGLKDATLVDQAPIPSFQTGPALCVPHQGQFSPLPYVEMLCELITKQGGEIYCGTHGKDIEEKEGLFTIHTNHKATVAAKHVVLATNAFTGKAMYPKQAQYRTYAIGAKVPRGSVPKALYYDTLDPYHYIRIAELDKEFDLLIVGGEDHRTAEEEDVNLMYLQLENWARERFPMMGKVQYHWSGQIAEPIDGLGFIGRAKKDAEKYFITGHSGNGLTYATLGAMLVSDLILGKSNVWEKIYDPGRVSFKNIDEFFKENLNSVWQYRDWVTPGEIDSTKELKRGCGAILRKGLTKHACYKDAEGKVHEMSAKCPHLGAVVRWNESEHCWECPAHGSRFSAEGKCLLGPANCDLKPI